jgi:hypothetical protein
MFEDFVFGRTTLSEFGKITKPVFLAPILKLKIPVLVVYFCFGFFVQNNGDLEFSHAGNLVIFKAINVLRSFSLGERQNFSRLSRSNPLNTFSFNKTKCL